MIRPREDAVSLFYQYLQVDLKTSYIPILLNTLHSEQHYVVLYQKKSFSEREL